jgi:polar amino acid transport system substrate-binding protein
MLCCARTDSQQVTSELALVKQRGVLVMLCFPHQDSEFVRVNLERGPMKHVGTAEDFAGFDVDLIQAFAVHLGVKLELRPVSKPSYSELVPALLRNEGDLVASSFSITPEREKVVDFSTPYLRLAELVLTRKGVAIRGPEDLKGKTAAMIAGSSQAERLRALGVADKPFVEVEFTRDKYIAVAEGKADYTVVDDGYMTKKMMDEFSDLAIVLKLGVGAEYAVAVRQGSDLKPALDSFLTELRRSGKLAAIAKTWGRTLE